MRQVGVFGAVDHFLEAETGVEPEGFGVLVEVEELGAAYFEGVRGVGGSGVWGVGIRVGVEIELRGGVGIGIGIGAGIGAGIGIGLRIGIDLGIGIRIGGGRVGGEIANYAGVVCGEGIWG